MVINPANPTFILINLFFINKLCRLTLIVLFSEVSLTKDPVLWAIVPLMQTRTYKFIHCDRHYALIFKAGKSIQEYEFYTQTTWQCRFQSLLLLFSVTSSLRIGRLFVSKRLYPNYPEIQNSEFRQEVRARHNAQ